MLPEWFPLSHQDSAEQVRDYLVSIRGGAPFLSGADCQLLVSWLDEQIPVPAILCAIDKVSLRRRAKRVRTRLSLNSCKGELQKILTKNNADQSKNIKDIGNGLNLLAEKILTSLNDDKKFVKEKISVANKFKKLSQDDRATEIIAKDAIQLITDFHSFVWQESYDRHEVFTQQAEEELSGLQNLLSSMRWQEAVEEVARDRLRAQFPLFSAQMIWNALHQVLV
jgi:hypothetical protein